MKIVGIIPARLGSSRFPGKPLAPILGRPMIEHVYHRTALCPALDEVYVATCDREIADRVRSFGGKFVMTRASHTRASDRVAEAARGLGADLIVMVQGDEPMIVPEMVEKSIDPFLRDADVQCVNLVKRIETEPEWRDPNTIKVVMNRHGDALYFSRETIPASTQIGFHQMRIFKQVCVIPFRTECLRKYAELEPTPLEIAESIDMLRLLENGLPVRLVETDVPTYAVDTPADLTRVESRMRTDPLIARYPNPAAGAVRP